LTQRGCPHSAADTASAVAVAEWANMRERSSTLGQLTLTSTATTGAPTSSAAAAAKSSTLRPQMLATTRAPVAASGGRSSANQCRTPPPCRPTLLSIPPRTSRTRGAGLPGQAAADWDFATTAPRAPRAP
jgi:hypothetical protein